MTEFLVRAANVIEQRQLEVALAAFRAGLLRYTVDVDGGMLTDGDGTLILVTGDMVVPPSIPGPKRRGRSS